MNQNHARKDGQHKTNDKAVQAMKTFLEALGLDLDELGMTKTPMRVTEAFSRFFSGLQENPLVCWGNLIQTQSDGLVAIRGIHFHSICEHHLLPFYGTVHIVYEPNDGKIAGFSHFAEVVDVVSRRPQLQERFTHDICQAIQNGLQAKGTLVIVEGTHLCLKMLHQLGSDSDIITQAAMGSLKNDTEAYRCARALLVKEDNVK